MAEYNDYTHLTAQEMNNINLLAEAIRHKVYGIDVRESIALSIELMLDIFSKENNDAVAEIIKARNEFGSLDDRLDDMLANLENISVNQINKNLGKFDSTYFSDEFLNDLAGGNLDVTNILKGSVTGDKLSFGSVSPYKIYKGVTFEGGNIYFSPDNYIDGQYVRTDTGDITSNSAWGTGFFKVNGGDKFTIWLPTNTFSGFTLIFRDATGTVLKQYTPSQAMFDPTGNVLFRNNRYLQVEAPSNSTEMYFNAKTTSYDGSQSTIVIKGLVTLTEQIVNDGKVTSLFGKSLVSEPLKPYVGKKWVAFGDSLTESNSRTTKNYHGYVADDLGLTVINMGVGGTGYKRTDDASTAFYQRISNVPTDADAITIFGSFNDLGAGVPIGTASDTGTDTLGGAINATLDNLNSRLPVVPVGIISPTPWQSSKPWDDSNSATQYVELLKDICDYRGLPFLDLYHNSGLRPWDENYRTLMYSRDDGNGTHPDEKGHKLFYPQVREFMKALI